MGLCIPPDTLFFVDDTLQPIVVIGCEQVFTSPNGFAMLIHIRCVSNGITYDDCITAKEFSERYGIASFEEIFAVK